MWFVKSRRAKNVDDFETWLQGGVVPTLNVFNNSGDTRANTAGPQGKGFTDEGNPMFTLTKTDIHAVAFDTYNQTISDKNKTLNSAATDVDHTGAIWKGTMVRRLTPTECERLQGFPDRWTEGQADTHRYKQMGNAVAVPVVSWLVNRLMEVSNDPR